MTNPITHVAGDVAHGIHVGADAVAHGAHVTVDAIGHGAMDVVHAVQSTVSVGEKLIKVIHDGRELTPQFKAELATLTNDAKEIAAILAPVIATKGTVITLDIAAIEPAITDVVKLVKDFLAFLPTLESAVSKIAADLK